MMPLAMPSFSIPSTAQATKALIHLRQGLVLLLAAAGLYVLLALLSYHPTDPGPSSTGDGGAIHNAGGRTGAWLADALFFWWGYPAVLSPMLFIPPALMLLGSIRSRPDWLTGSIRTIGMLLLLLATATLAEAGRSIHWLELPNGNGGWLGKALAAQMHDAFGKLGSQVLLAGVFLLGLTTATGISWTKLADRLGLGAEHLGIRLWTGASQALVRLRRGRIPLKQLRRLWPFLRAAFTSLYRRSRRLAAFRFKRKATAGQVLRSGSVEAASSQASAGTTATVLGANPGIPPSVPIPATRQARQASGKEHEQKPPSQQENKVAGGQSRPAGASHSPPASAKAATPAKAAPSAPRSSAAGNRPGDQSTMPSLALLDAAGTAAITTEEQREALQAMARLLEEKLGDFGIQANVESIFPGPVITRFELKLAPGIKAARLTALVKDLARSLSVVSVRVVEIIPGKPVIGVEVPNPDRSAVVLHQVLSDKAYQDVRSPLALALGLDIAGKAMVLDLARMPHLLVAGTTGAGKSVCINAMLLSILYKSGPEDVRLLLVDPKMLELSVYEGIPHLLAPVITDMKHAANGLSWCVAEMERRYQLMTHLGVRNLDGFNQKIAEAQASGTPIEDPCWEGGGEDEEPPVLERLPYIMVVIDEFADMMMLVGKKVEQLIARVAQKARAAGIHLVLATQRPSVDVITGLIKANIPARISFQVSSKIDSRTILDQTGAEQLLGRGDMLFLPPGSSNPIRIHGAFVSDGEVHRVVVDWKERSEPQYLITADKSADGTLAGMDKDEGDKENDPLYDEAVDHVARSRRASISSVQRQLRIGYNRAARIVEAMEAAGVVSAASHDGSRQVLVREPEN